MIRTDTAGRIVRSALQLVAGGGLAAVVAALADGAGPVAAAALALGSTFLVTTCQNLLEENGVIPTLLKPKPVAELVDEAGEVVGEVMGVPAEVEAVAGLITDDAGEIVGAVGPKDEASDEG